MQSERLAPLKSIGLVSLHLSGSSSILPLGCVISGASSPHLFMATVKEYSRWPAKCAASFTGVYL